MPDGAATPAGAILLYGMDDPPCFLIITKVDHHLVDHYVVENRIAGGCQPFGKTGGVATSALDQIGHPTAPQ